jgi:hypothetical protein
LRKDYVGAESRVDASEEVECLLDEIFSTFDGLDEGSGRYPRPVPDHRGALPFLDYLLPNDE